MKLPNGYSLIEYISIDSTNLEARRLIQGGKVKNNPLVISAKSQISGKGRLGRNWVSLEGNLFVSVVVGPENRISNKLRTTNHDPQPSLIPFLTATAIGETLSNFTTTKPLYKWPNDVLVSGKKISGVLIEVIDGYVIVGIGINIANHPIEGTKLPATCLNNQAGRQVQVEEVLELLLYNLDKRISNDTNDIISEWTDFAYGIGKKVRVEQGEKEIIGIFQGIDENGWLILETETGRREVVLFGDVSWI